MGKAFHNALPRAGFSLPIEIGFFSPSFFPDTQEPAVDAPEVIRNLAAILCADVKGYSRLMGADEAGERI